jgi:putative RNA 2'-phosphotransferase
MDQKRLIKTSKYLSRHLRHRPERLGLRLAPGGWVNVDALLRACHAQSFDLTLEELYEVVADNDKKRFSFDKTGERIRANQGHSVAVDLGLEPIRPPTSLYHGTSLDNLDSIMEGGLQRMGRHHVHLSPDVASARRVASRRRRPVLLQIAAGQMFASERVFYVTENDVWLTLEVPVCYLVATHALT